MTFSTPLLFTLSLAHLGLLFLIAHAADKGWIPARITRHPWVYTLSLGVFVSIWGYFGVLQFATESGFNFLAYYLGPAGAFLIAPAFLRPLRDLARSHQLHSLPDLLAYRFRSQAVGTLATLSLLIGVMPLLTAQIQTMGEVLQRLSGDEAGPLLGLTFCGLLILFTLLFGARKEGQRGASPEGLVVAIAVESVIKLVAFAGVGLVACTQVFGGLDGLDGWLQEHPQALDMLFVPLGGGYWHSLLLVFFLSAVVMPCMYQMTFTESRSNSGLNTASWGMPLYLLIMAAGIPVLLWAGMALGLTGSPAYYPLGIVQQSASPWLALVLFLGSVSAVSGMLIVTTLALTSMTLNHVLLPLRGWQPDDALYSQTLRLRRLLITSIPLAAFTLAMFPDRHPDGTEMSMLAFVAVLQLAPGLLALLFWPRATAGGVIAGLLFGMLCWTLALLLPALFMPDLGSDWPLMALSQRLDHWHAVGLVATLGNALLLILVSLLSQQTAADLALAESCSADSLRSPGRWRLSAGSVQEVQHALAAVLGPVTAEREVRLACQDLGLRLDESRPYALRRLRDQLYGNLSGLLGPNLAREIVEAQLPQASDTLTPGDDIHYLESHLEDYRDRLSGLAAELDLLRRFHRQTLHDLPLGVLTLTGDREIMSWNRAMMAITGCPDERVIGSRVDALPAPWGSMLLAFMAQPAAQQLRQRVEVDGQVHWFHLHRAVIGDDSGSQVLVMEDATPLQQLESRLQHAERLAAIGRLAAGVAHEIGNPVTGIASLAQNLQAEYDDDDDISDTASAILEQTQRVTRIVQSLVGFSRSDQQSHGQIEAVTLQDVVAEAVHLLQLSPAARQQEYRIRIDSELQVSGDAQRLYQLFVNLLGNARDASTQHGLVLISAERHGDRVAIDIEDFGHGLPDSLSHDQLFEPFVTTKPAGKGTGLGLALAHGIVEAHQGRIQLVNKRDYDQGDGVIVKVTLPAWRPRRPVTSKESVS